jgi:hypothetical protein
MQSPRPASFWVLDWADTRGRYIPSCFVGHDLTHRHFAVSPGRFFAVNEVKALFAHIVSTYDIEIEGGKGVPNDVCIAGLRFPKEANVMFRTRQK